MTVLPSAWYWALQIFSRVRLGYDHSFQGLHSVFASTLTVYDIHTPVHNKASVGGDLR